MITAEQKANRNQGIFGSDAAAIVNAYPKDAKWAAKYTPFRLWQLKLGMIEDEDISDNPRVKAGNFLEEAIIKWFEAEKGLVVNRPEHTFVHPKYDWMRGHVDGLTVTLDGKKAVVEAKTADARSGKYWCTNGAFIPDHYLMQVVHYMAITDSDMAFVAALIGGNDFRVYEIPRNKKLEEKLIEKERIFWEEHVKKEIPPEPSTFSDIQAFYPHSDEKIVVAPHAIEMHFEELRSLRAQITELEQKAEAYRKEICAFMGEAETIVDGFGSILATWKTTNPIRRIDVAALKKEVPVIYESYLKYSSPSRPFKMRGEE